MWTFSPKMYCTPDGVVKFLRSEDNVEPSKQHPVILCEYSHAMGNSSGCLSEYWDLVRKEPRFQGGFIWDWKDQGLTRKAEPTVSVSDFANPSRSIEVFAMSSRRVRCSGFGVAIGDIWKNGEEALPRGKAFRRFIPFPLQGRRRLDADSSTHKRKDAKRLVRTQPERFR